jgi:hypothetical protein
MKHHTPHQTMKRILVPLAALTVLVVPLVALPALAQSQEMVATEVLNLRIGTQPTTCEACHTFMLAANQFVDGQLVKNVEVECLLDGAIDMPAEWTAQVPDEFKRQHKQIPATMALRPVGIAFALNNVSVPAAHNFWRGVPTT